MAVVMIVQFAMIKSIADALCPSSDKTGKTGKNEAVYVKPKNKK